MCAFPMGTHAVVPRWVIIYLQGSPQQPSPHTCSMLNRSGRPRDALGSGRVRRPLAGSIAALPSQLSSSGRPEDKVSGHGMQQPVWVNSCTARHLAAGG